ncbi:MAG: DUF2520 domain-containing protein [Nocardioidaceae bacterium]|nr:DUF2520 domain-containing protein [Nocardioidaceae bacterium]
MAASNCLVPVRGTGTKGSLVVDHSRLRVGVTGAGRVGSVIAAKLRASGHDIVAVSGSSDASRTRIETMLPGVDVLAPASVADRSDVLVLAVPDDVLVEVVSRLAADGHLRPGQLVVHTSGRHGTNALRAARRVGARVIAMHPAMTFTGADVDVDRLDGCVFGLTADSAERDVAESLVAALGGSAMWVAEDQRALYHASLAHGSNHLVTLVSQAMALLRRAGAEDPAAVLQPLLQAALDNALAYGDAALTGPVVRGDVTTVEAHLAALADAPASTLGSYLAMAAATADHAVADGRLSHERADELRDLLGGTAQSHLRSNDVDSSARR